MSADTGISRFAHGEGQGSVIDPFVGSTLFTVCQEELELKSLLLDAMLDAVMAHTLEGQIIYVNEPACAMYGLTPDQFVNLPPWGWIEKSMRGSVGDRLEAMRQRGGLVFESVGPTYPDGSPMHIEVHARIIEIPGYGEALVSVMRDATERYLEVERIRHLAFHDQLTGLPNRPNFEERLHIALAEADRHNDVVGVIFLDLDDFKPINDTLGHASGDRVLVAISDRLRDCVRESDLIARIGGDEFMGLFPRLASRRDLAGIAKSLVDCVTLPLNLDGIELRLGASVGLAVYQHGEATDELITRADHAMYRAKLNGLVGWEEFLREE